MIVTRMCFFSFRLRPPRFRLHPPFLYQKSSQCHHWKDQMCLKEGFYKLFSEIIDYTVLEYRLNCIIYSEWFISVVGFFTCDKFQWHVQSPFLIFLFFRIFPFLVTICFENFKHWLWSLIANFWPRPDHFSFQGFLDDLFHSGSFEFVLTLSRPSWICISFFILVIKFVRPFHPNTMLWVLFEVVFLNNDQPPSIEIKWCASPPCLP